MSVLVYGGTYMLYDKKTLNLAIKYQGKVRYLSMLRSEIRTSVDLTKRIMSLFELYTVKGPIILINYDGDNIQLTNSIPSGSYSMYVPPPVSCHHWIIAENDSGEILFEYDSKKEVQPASLTKMMTLYTVIRAYNSDEDEMSNDYVKISKRSADCKNGTHAHLQYEDVLSVFDLLYAMMLPSGNDAAIALAEHVGQKMLIEKRYNSKINNNNIYNNNDDEDDDVYGRKEVTELEGYNAFIKKMNKHAKRLNMRNTHYVNPHGMRSENNLSTASDIMKLGLHCQLFPLFNTIISTKTYTCVIQGKSRCRSINWHNTHILIGTDGFLAGKTGWVPNPNGPGIHGNLWSIVERNRLTLSIVTLGSVDQNMRFIDTRMLVDWAYSALHVKFFGVFCEK